MRKINFREKNMSGHYRRHCAVSCAKMAEQLEMLFGFWTRLGPRKHVLYDSAHWCKLANIRLNRPCSVSRMKRRRCGLTSNYFDHLFNFMPTQPPLLFLRSVFSANLPKFVVVFRHKSTESTLPSSAIIHSYVMVKFCRYS